MKKLHLILSMSLLLCGLSTTYAADNGIPNPVGYWKQMSDNNQPQSIMYLWLDNHHILHGKVVAGFLMNGKVPQGICAHCPAPFTNKPILGMEILWGFTNEDEDDDNYWSNGFLLDPDRASIYHGTLTLENNGNSMKVRGYIGIPLFGRTQTWYHLTDDQAKAIGKTAYQSIIGS